jgi:signal transduction histidine kinase
LKKIIANYYAINLPENDRLKLRAFNYIIIIAFFVALAHFIFSIVDQGMHYATLYRIAIYSSPLIFLGIAYVISFRVAIACAIIVLPLNLCFLSINQPNVTTVYYLYPFILFSFFFIDNKKWLVGSFVYLAMLIFIVHYENANRLFNKQFLNLEFVNLICVFVLIFSGLYFVKLDALKTKQEIKEKNVKLQESNVLKDRLFSILSHDLKTPISSVQLLLNSNIDERITFEMFKKVVPQIKKELDTTSILLDSLLGWIKNELANTAIQTEKVSIKDTTLKVLQTLHASLQAKQISIRYQIENDILVTNKDILEIMLRNLVNNAIKFSHIGNDITISSTSTKNHFVVSVKDNGIGISKEALRKLQEQSFYSSPGTNEEQGHGLGLMICRELLKKYDGYIHIESDTNLGTIVSIYLPKYL